MAAYEKIQLENGGVYYKKVETHEERVVREKKEKLLPKVAELKGLDKSLTVKALEKRVEAMELLLEEFLK